MEYSSSTGGVWMVVPVSLVDVGDVGVGVGVGGTVCSSLIPHHSHIKM